MPDYYTFQQAIQTLGITEANITKLQRKGVLLPTVMDGRSFLSSHQVYRLRVAIRWARKDKIDLQEALKKVEEHWLAKSSARKD
jgi:hypothetical protein